MPRVAQQGFVLVTSIWVLAALVLFVSFIAIATEKVIADTQQVRLSVQSMLDRRATESTVLYLLATQPVTRGGLTVTPASLQDNELESNGFEFAGGDPFEPTGKEIRLDAKAYAGIGDVLFSLRETSASISLRANRANSREYLRHVLRSYGLSRDEITQLVDRLRDYVDRDSEPSINGMEAAGYKAAGYQRPTNRFLSSPTQLKNVPGWSDALGDNFEHFLDLVTIDAGNRPNFNTAHPEAMIVYGLNTDAVQKVVGYREQGVFKTLADVNKVTGHLVPIDPLEFTSVPGDFVRLILRDRSSGQAHWIGIKLTPRVGNAPFKIAYRVAIPHVLARSPMGTVIVNDSAIDPATPQSLLFR
jgi:hypothetical protein